MHMVTVMYMEIIPSLLQKRKISVQAIIMIISLGVEDFINEKWYNWLVNKKDKLEFVEVF